MVLTIVYLLVFWCLGRADKITSCHTERFSTHVSLLSEFPLQCLGQAHTAAISAGKEHKCCLMKGMLGVHHSLMETTRLGGGRTEELCAGGQRLPVPQEGSLGILQTRGMEARGFLLPRRCD